MEIPAGREAAVDKEIEMTSATNTISNTILEATSNLAENIAQSEPFFRFKQAEGKLHADQEATRLLTDLSEMQQKIRQQQGSSAVSESDLQRLRSLQSAMGTNEIIQDYQMTQELAAAFLREVNQEISNLLSIDFASLTRRSGGCC
jgi:cell fate (sporulation/competence/biofilm development) regulator YlbF (YheA/YmcA/DUF963 family)